jgi:hypothetical protein
MATTYHAVKDVTNKKQTWRLAVMVDDLWTIFKGEDEDHAEMLLRDVNVSIFHTFIVLLYISNSIHTFIVKPFYDQYFLIIREILSKLGLTNRIFKCSNPS